MGLGCSGEKMEIFDDTVSAMGEQKEFRVISLAVFLRN